MTETGTDRASWTKWQWRGMLAFAFLMVANGAWRDLGMIADVAGLIDASGELPVEATVGLSHSTLLFMGLSSLISSASGWRCWREAGAIAGRHAWPDRPVRRLDGLARGTLERRSRLGDPDIAQPRAGDDRGCGHHVCLAPVQPRTIGRNVGQWQATSGSRRGPDVLPSLHPGGIRLRLRRHGDPCSSSLRSSWTANLLFGYWVIASNYRRNDAAARNPHQDPPACVQLLYHSVHGQFRHHGRAGRQHGKPGDASLRSGDAFLRAGAAHLRHLSPPALRLRFRAQPNPRLWRDQLHPARRLRPRRMGRGAPHSRAMA